MHHHFPLVDSLAGGPRVLACPPLASHPLPPGPSFSLVACDVCNEPAWMGPDGRALIVELEHRDLDYEIRCEAHTLHGYDDYCPHLFAAGNESDRMRLLRGGGAPRHEFVLIRMEDIPAIMEANPGFNPLSRG